MKDKIRKICYDLELGCIDWIEASEQLFALTDVVKSLPIERPKLTTSYNELIQKKCFWREKQ